MAGASKKRKASGLDSEATAIEQRLATGHDLLTFMGAYTPYDSFDFRALGVKPDHAKLPLWVCPNGQVFLEEYSPSYKQARDFLVQIAEPCSRPFYIHEYRLEKNALFAAASMGFTAEVIAAVLERLSKTPVADTVKMFIRDCTVGYGKVKLVLSRGKYYMESSNPDILRKLNEDDTVKAARVKTVGVRACCRTSAAGMRARSRVACNACGAFRCRVLALAGRANDGLCAFRLLPASERSQPKRRPTHPLPPWLCAPLLRCACLLFGTLCGTMVVASLHCMVLAGGGV
jgi:hypothetical protein